MKSLPRLIGCYSLLVVSLVQFFSTWAEAGEPPREILTQQTLFRAGDDGYHSYRIPALIVAPDGAVLAFCEARKNSRADHGDIDLVMKRSTDHGITWSEMMVLADDGEHTMGNPCPVVERETGVIWLPFCRDNNTVHVMSSADNGESWSDADNITEQVKLREWGDGWYATGPTHGIQTASGRLVIPCDHDIGKKHYSHVFYSDDRGASWKLGGSLEVDTNECGVVELANGSLLINMRSYRGKHQRTTAISRDGGLTWTPPKDEPELIEPVCQGNILRLSTEKSQGKNRILFSNPASTTRENLTVRCSYDECKTWQIAKPLFRGPSAYSDLAVGDDGMIVCLYERGQKSAYETITFARFNLAWLTDGADQVLPSK